MIVSCPSCSTRYRLDAERLRAGKGRLRCARCRAVFPVSAGEAPPPQENAAPARLEIALLASEPGPSQKRLQGVLRGLGLRLALADDGPNALDVARRSRPRLLVVSHWLPGLTGPEIIATLREEPTLAATRMLLVGGPKARLRWPASAAALHGADAHLAADAREPEIESAVRAVLGMPQGMLPLPSETEVRAHARWVVSDLLLCFQAELEEGRREGRLHERVTDALALARECCQDRFPELRFSPEGLAAWDDEIKMSLRRSG